LQAARLRGECSLGPIPWLDQSTICGSSPRLVHDPKRYWMHCPSSPLAYWNRTSPSSFLMLLQWEIRITSTESMFGPHSTDALEHRGLPEDAVSRCVLRREHERINYSVDVAQGFRLIFLTLVTCERFFALKWGSSVTVVVTGATVYEGKCCMLGTWSIRMIVLGVPIISYVQSLNSTHDISLQISGILRAARSWSKLIGTPRRVPDQWNAQKYCGADPLQSWVFVRCRRVRGNINAVLPVVLCYCSLSCVSCK